MERIELAAARRELEKRAAKRLRQEGKVPGMLYGHGVGNVPLQMVALDLKRTLSQAGASQLIHLRIDDGPKTQPVLAREIQRDVFSGDPIHVDFLAVSMTERITAEVTITLVGEPEVARTGTGILLQGANVIEIECLPGDLIPALEVDVSDLDYDTALLVEDLRVPDNVTILSDPQEMVAQVVREALEVEEEEEEEALLMEEPTEVEVISRGKAAEEEEEA
jgi:large subunit ribosomal protein L25